MSSIHPRRMLAAASAACLIVCLGLIPSFAQASPSPRAPAAAAPQDLSLQTTASDPWVVSRETGAFVRGSGVVRVARLGTGR